MRGRHARTAPSADVGRGRSARPSERHPQLCAPLVCVAPQRCSSTCSSSTCCNTHMYVMGMCRTAHSTAGVVECTYGRARVRWSGGLAIRSRFRNIVSGFFRISIEILLWVLLFLYGILKKWPRPSSSSGAGYSARLYPRPASAASRPPPPHRSKRPPPRSMPPPRPPPPLTRR